MLSLKQSGMFNKFGGGEAIFFYSLSHWYLKLPLLLAFEPVKVVQLEPEALSRHLIPFALFRHLSLLKINIMHHVISSNLCPYIVLNQTRASTVHLGQIDSYDEPNQRVFTLVLGHHTFTIFIYLIFCVWARSDEFYYRKPT